MRYSRIIFASLLAVLVVMPLIRPATVRAQHATDVGKVEEALARTEEIIDEARSAIAESRSSKARLRIEKAEAIQRRARESFKGKAYRISLELTLQARQEAKQAMATARLEMQAEVRLGRMIEETTERIAGVREIAVEGQIKAERVMKMIEEARNLLERARLNANQYRYQLAINLAENARQRATRAEQQIRTIHAAKETAVRRLALMERLIDRARERIRESHDERGARQLERAERQWHNARELLRDGKYRAARMTIEQCEKTLRNLTRRLRRQSLSDPVAALEEGRRLLERAERMVQRNASGMNRPGTERIEQAGRILDRAEREAASGNGAEAQRLVSEARRLLREAVAYEREMQDAGAVTRLLEQVRAMRDETASFVETCTAPGVGTLLERADRHLDRATALLRRGETDAAAAEARIARNMYNRIREICARL